MIKVNEIKKNNKTNNNNSSITVFHNFVIYFLFLHAVKSYRSLIPLILSSLATLEVRDGPGPKN